MTLQTALAGPYYVDPDIFAAENQRIFSGSWQILGSASSITAPGSYLVADYFGKSVIVIRGEDQEIRAFLNVCRHRGSKLLDGESGQCETIKCPYHDWRYRLDGTLEDTPWFGDASPFALESLPLKPVRLEVWRGLIFIAIDPLISLLEQLGDLPSELQEVPLEEMTETGSCSFSADVNWKAYLDQFNEYYHSPAVHAPDKSVGIQHYTAIPFNQGMVMQAPPDAAFYGGKWLWSWPNWTISAFPGGAKISRVIPTGPSSIIVRFHFLFSDLVGEPTPGQQRVIDATTRIFDEDVVAVRRVQRSMEAGMFDDPGPLHPVHEQATAYFQERVRLALL